MADERTRGAGTALVTGAASGIGLACAKLLLDDGWSVGAADIQPLPPSLALEAPAGCLREIACDVSNEEACRAAVAETVAAFGGLHALLHFAAFHSTNTWQELSAEEFTRTQAVNVTGSFLMAREAARHMAEHGGGAIVLTGSGSMNSGGIGGHGRGGPAYIASKAAIVGLTRSLARSFGPHDIRVNAVFPGAADTAMTAGYDEDARSRVAERTILGRIGTAAEIASVARFLVSDDARYMTGETVNVNGGGSFGL